MRVTISLEVSDEARQALATWYGLPGLATAEDVARWGASVLDCDLNETVDEIVFADGPDQYRRRLALELGMTGGGAPEATETAETLEDSLLSLTPGGSEFVGSPKACLAFVRERMTTVMKVASQNKRLQAEVTKLRGENENLRGLSASVNEALNMGDGAYRP